MDLKKFQSQIASQGLARTNRWIVRVYPPPGLGSTNRVLSNFINDKFGSNLNVNIPVLNLLDTFTEAANNLNVDIGNVNIGTNLDLPTLGYVLGNLGTTLDNLNLFCHRASLPEINTQNFNWKEYGEVRKLGHTNTFGDATCTYYCSEDLRERKFFEEWNSLVYNHKNKTYGYYRDYTSRIEFIKYDASWNKQTAIYRFNEAYPSTIGTQEVNYDAVDLLRLDIAFKYRNYERIA